MKKEDQSKRITIGAPYRIYGYKAYINKEDAKAQTKRASKCWGGGYYRYKYSTKTLAYALKFIQDKNEVLKKLEIF